MDFNQLESFLQVVKHKSFSAAARELYLTQPTISNNIQNLENELNTILLDRKSKNITLTDSGKALYKYAVEIINIRDQAIYDIVKQSNSIEGHMEINASSIPKQYVLPYIIKDFIKKYPRILFSIIHKNSKDIVDDIIKGKLNFGIVGAKYPSKTLEYIDFYEDQLILAVPNNNDYLKYNDEPLDIEILFSENFIFREKGSGTRSFIEKALLENNVSLEDLNIRSFADSNEMIKKMIELELGISFISKLSIKNEIELGLIKPLKIKNLNLTRKFYFVYSNNRTQSPIVEAFKEFLDNWSGIRE